MYRKDRLCASLHHHLSIHLFWFLCSTHNHDNCLPKLSDICRSCLVVLAAMFPKRRPTEGEPGLNCPNCPAQLSPFIMREESGKSSAFPSDVIPLQRWLPAARSKPWATVTAKHFQHFRAALAPLITMTRMTHGISPLQNVLENIGAGQDQGLLTVIGNGEVPYIRPHPDLHQLANALKLKAFSYYPMIRHWGVHSSLLQLVNWRWTCRRACNILPAASGSSPTAVNSQSLLFATVIAPLLLSHFPMHPIGTPKLILSQWYFYKAEQSQLNKLSRNWARKVVHD